MYNHTHIQTIMAIKQGKNNSKDDKNEQDFNWGSQQIVCWAWWCIPVFLKIER